MDLLIVFEMYLHKVIEKKFLVQLGKTDEQFLKLQKKISKSLYTIYSLLFH